MHTNPRYLVLGGLVGALVLGSGVGGAVGARLVTSADIQDGTIRSRDLSPHLDDAVRAGLTGYEVVEDTTEIAPGASAGGGAVCPTGKAVLGGGWVQSELMASGPPLEIYEDQPNVYVPVPGGGTAPTAWTVSATNSGTKEVLLVVRAICAYPR